MNINYLLIALCVYTVFGYTAVFAQRGYTFSFPVEESTTRPFPREELFLYKIDKYGAVPVAQPKEKRVKFSGTYVNVFVQDLNNGDSILLDSVQTKLMVKVSDNTELVANARTGNTWALAERVYYSNWTDIDKSNFKMNLTHLYVNHQINDRSKVSFGSLQTKSSDGIITALSPEGWVEGMSFTYKKPDGREYFVMGGHLDFDDDPNMFKRKSWDFDFIQVQLSEQVKRKLFLELGAEWVDKTTFLRAMSKYDWEVVPNKMVDVITEVLYETKKSNFKWALTLRADPVEWITGQESEYSASIEYYGANEDIHRRAGEVNQRYYSGKEQVGVGFTGPIIEEYNTSFDFYMIKDLDGEEFRWELVFIWEF